MEEFEPLDFTVLLPQRRIEPLQAYPIVKNNINPYLWKVSAFFILVLLITILYYEQQLKEAKKQDSH
jgi:hypothetical protein